VYPVAGVLRSPPALAALASRERDRDPVDDA
jgi:hypothetical protein